MLFRGEKEFLNVPFLTARIHFCSHYLFNLREKIA